MKSTGARGERFAWLTSTLNGDTTGRATSRRAVATRWMALSVLVRQSAQLLFLIFLARLLGPEQMGVVSIATVYANLTTLLLDQGLAAALIATPVLRRFEAGAVSMINILVAGLLAAGTWAGAEAIADFFRAPGLAPVLRFLGCGLLLKAVAIGPRSMLARRLAFRAVGLVEVVAALSGLAGGWAAASAGLGALAVAAQALASDAVAGVAFIAISRGPMPNFRLRLAIRLLPFSLRVFAANLIAFLSRNVDNILIGRSLGVVALAPYAIGYRAVVVPVQLIGQTVKRVLFPTFSRLSDDHEAVRHLSLSAMSLLSFLTIPLMAWVAIAARDAIDMLLGPGWAAAAPVMSILAIAGARETIFYVTPSLMTGLGRADMNLKFEVFSTSLQVAGIVVGLSWGVMGVAVGYTVAGFMQLPVLMGIQRRLASVSITDQVRALVQPLHAALWASLAYLIVDTSSATAGTTLVLGSLAFMATWAVVMRLAHPVAFRENISFIGSVLGIRKS